MPRKWISRGDEDMLIKCVAVGRVRKITKCWFSSVVFVLFCFHCVSPKSISSSSMAAATSPVCWDGKRFHGNLSPFPISDHNSFSQPLHQRCENILTSSHALSASPLPGPLLTFLLLSSHTHSPEEPEEYLLPLETIRHYLCLYCTSSPRKSSRCKWKPVLGGLLARMQKGKSTWVSLRVGDILAWCGRIFWGLFFSTFSWNVWNVTAHPPTGAVPAGFWLRIILQLLPPQGHFPHPAAPGGINEEQRVEWLPAQGRQKHPTSPGSPTAAEIWEWKSGRASLQPSPCFCSI